MYHLANESANPAVHSLYQYSHKLGNYAGSFNFIQFSLLIGCFFTQALVFDYFIFYNISVDKDYEFVPLLLSGSGIFGL